MLITITAVSVCFGYFIETRLSHQINHTASVGDHDLLCLFSILPTNFFGRLTTAENYN